MSKQAKIFIEGAAGTTGLEIRERLAGRSELSLISLSDADRKDPAARKGALNAADAVILCLPDEAAREAVSLIDNPATRVIDASSAHRVADGWAYGFAELEPDGYAKISAAKRVSNPGCWPTGFLAIMRPLVRAGLVPPDYPVSVSGVSGYSGGGKSMIADLRPDAEPQAYPGNAEACRPVASAGVPAQRGTLLPGHAGGSAVAALGL